MEKQSHPQLLIYVQNKYRRLYSRFQKAIKNGNFVRLSNIKKQQLLNCLSRYERQLKLWGIAVMTSTTLVLPVDTIMAQPIPDGSEFQVNTYMTDAQNNPAIAMDIDGDFVVVWESNNQDGSTYGIFGQRYNNAGLPQGGEFRVNTYTTSDQANPSVAMDDAGNFVIAWQGQGDTDASGIYAQRYNSEGVAQGNEFRVNTFTTNLQSSPSIAMDSGGNFVITWASSGQEFYSFTPHPGIYAQRFNSVGMPQGNEFHVNSYTINSQGNPSVDMDSDGDFVIAWESYGQDSGPDGFGTGVYAQAYNSKGKPRGHEFQVNTYTTYEQSNPAVAMDNEGDFVIAWDSWGQDGLGYGVFAQRYNNRGITQGSEFQVNTYTTSAQFQPSVDKDRYGNFVISWQSGLGTPPGQNGDLQGVFAQAYNNSGLTQGGEFQVNTYTTYDQSHAAVAISDSGNFIIAWDSDAQESGSSGIYAQRHYLPCHIPYWYEDNDSDGYGSGPAILNCEQPPGTSSANDDCDDNNIAIYPGAAELCNGLDDNCNNKTDENVLDCPVPTGLSTTDITSTSAQLQWIPIPCSRNYKINLVRVSDNFSDNITGNLSGSATVEGLLPSTLYKWNIKTKCAASLWSSVSPWQQFTTSAIQLQVNTAGKNNQRVASDKVPKITLFPNPSTGIFIVSTMDKPFQQLIITDLMGRIVWQKADMDTTKTEMDIQFLAPGLYFLYIQSGNENSAMPFVIIQ